MKKVADILEQEEFSKLDLITLLESHGAERNLLFQKALEMKTEHVGKKVFFRGLVEFYNACAKDC